MLQKTILQVGIKLLAIICGVFITRWQVTNFSTDEFANYSLILSYNSIILMAVSWGLPQIIQKVFTNKDQQIFSISDFWTTTIVLRALSYLVGLLLIMLTYKFSQTSDLILIIGVFTAQFILLSDLAFRSITDSNNNSWQFSVTDLIGKLILVISIFGLSKVFGIGIFGFTITSIIAYFCSFLADSVWQRHSYSWGKFDFKIIKLELGAIGFLTLADLVNGIYSKTDLLFLRYFNFDLFQVASYSNAYKLFEIATVIPGLTMPVLASILRKKLNNKTIIKKNLIKYYGIAFGVGILVTLVVNIFAELGIWLIDPDGKYDSLNLLRILSLIIVVLFPALLSSDLLNISGFEKKQFWSKLWTAILAIILYLALIPMYGGVGAALATLIFFTFEFMVKTWYVYRTL